MKNNGKGAQIVKYKETEAGARFGWPKKDEVLVKIPDAVVSTLISQPVNVYNKGGNITYHGSKVINGTKLVNYTQLNSKHGFVNTTKSPSPRSSAKTVPS